MRKKGYPSDVSDEEWEYVAPYLTLMKVTMIQQIKPPVRKVVK